MVIQIMPFRAFSRVIQSRKSIEQLIVDWNFKDSEKGRRLIMELQPFDSNCAITIVSSQIYLLFY